MPKFGLKCFLGSFILSLVAVVAATKSYFVLSADSENKTTSVTQTETKTIELFAANEENDPIVEKYNQVTQQNDINGQTTAANSDADDVLLAADDTSNEGEGILFAPNDDSTEDMPKEMTAENTPPVEDADVLSSAEETKENRQDIAAAEPEKAKELKIVDAAEATVFEIPLIHSFAPESNNVKVLQKADTNQLALATDNVPLENLGATSQPAVQMAQNDLPEDDPWEVAEVANKNQTRNKNAEVADKQAPTTGNSVPYKMQKNLLIPIPDEIANDKNLTPQFSSSAENIKLEEKLRRKRGLPPLNANTDEATDKPAYGGGENGKTVSSSQKEEEEMSEEESGSLTDSIAAWFSGNKKKSEQDRSADKKEDDKSVSRPSGQQESSLFRKLLGLGNATKDNISPTELKLSFQANRAEISGQTLEWIKAFSENVVKYDDVAIEIRLDRNASYELQQKRLNLLYKILANNGVEYRKVNIIFTDREPNSFIIRNVRYVTNEEKTQIAEKAKSPWY
jgi:hypothetical protein